MLAELPLSQYVAWQRFCEREPFGPQAWDLRIGYILAVLVNALTGEKTKPADYVPRWGESEPPRQDWREMRQVFKDWRNAHDRQNQG